MKNKKINKKMNKILTVFIILILLISTSAFLYASSVIDDPIEIVFQDKNLYNAIKLHCQSENLKYNVDELTLTITMSEEELKQIEELNLQGTDGAKITNIIGLEYFDNLKIINLANNSITDITPISQLSNLISINLSNNANVNLSNLPNKTKLEELNIASTQNSDITFISEMSSLTTLNISNNGISVLTPLKSLQLQVLDVSENTAITTIDDILAIKTLKDLNIATTGIRSLLHSDYIDDEYENGIFLLTKLQSLNISNNEISIEPILETYYQENTETGEEEEKVYLSALQKLNFNYTKQNYIDYERLSKLEELTHLYMKGNEIYSVGDYIATLPNLEYIDLSDNQIEDIGGFIKYGQDDNGNEIIEDRLSAKQIILANNRIQKIEPLAYINHDITYLDLSYNLIFYTSPLEMNQFSFEQGLNLTNQGRNKYDYNGEEEHFGLEIKDKKAEINQYIILPTLFQSSKNPNSPIYAENITFSYENITLNSDAKYQEPGCYNIVIEPEQEEENDGEEVKTYSITLNGGVADNSILYFHYTESDSSIDSLIFADTNLANAIETDIRSQIGSDNDDEYYIVKAKDLMNITNYLISNTEVLHLEDKNISNLSGLESFENLTHVYFSNNNISSIEPLKYCENMVELYAANNPNMGNNNSAIVNMNYLKKLDLSTTGMTDIESLKNLITKWQEYDNYSLTYLNLSNNDIKNIENVGLINSLEELHISNIGITNLEELKTLTNLKTLNVSGNEIQEINVLEKLTKLKYLTISNNNIKDITPISIIALDSLDFSNNKVKDVSSLTRTYTSIKMDTNRISDISNFEGKIIPTFSVANQKIAQTIDSDMDEDIIIELPQIFKDSKISGSKVYTANNFVTTNCELTSDGLSIKVNPVTLGDNIATVKINGGNANLTTFSIAAPIKGIITYNPSNEVKTNQDITATITFNRNNVTITNNEGQNTYTFTQNGEFTFEFEDENGFTGTEKAIVNNIDKEAPQKTEIKQEIVDKKIVVTIKVNEEIIEPNGWTLADDKLSITKTFTEDANEIVELEDEVGNKTTVNVEVSIDKNAPIITGVDNGKKYNKPVTPVVEDDNLETVTLTKDEVEVTDYESGTEIKDIGKYELTATDKFGNTTTVSFEIEALSEEEVITSTVLTIDEEKLFVKDIQPNTTVEEIQEYIQTNSTFEIINNKDESVLGTDKIATGYKLKIDSGKTYILIVKGDTNGDAKTNINDIFSINSHRLGIKLIKGEYLEAADVNEDGVADVRDIFKVNSYRLRGGNI